MSLHNWMESSAQAGRIEGLSYVTQTQTFKCRNCDETITLPDCSSKSRCKHLMSFGCTKVKEKVAWKSPIKEKAPYEDKTDYPKKAGNLAKRRK